MAKKETDLGLKWQMDAQTMGVMILSLAQGLVVDSILETFGPVQHQQPLFISEISCEPTASELLEIAQKAGEMSAQEKAGHVVRKLGDGTWTYRRLSWTQGVFWFAKPGPLHKILARM